MDMYYKRKTSNTEVDEQWVISYADMISAMLAVLILIFSVSKFDTQSTFIDNDVRSTKNVPEKISSMLNSSSTIPEFEKHLKKVIKNSGLENSVDLIIFNNELTISFSNVAWFQVGKSFLNTDKLQVYLPIFEVIKTASEGYRIDIEGHTDDQKGATPIDNWKLSTLRSLNLMQYLIASGFNDRNMRIVALADTSPMVPLDNLSPVQLEKAREKNRRVSIVVKEVSKNDRR